MTRSASSPITARSWLMKSIAVPRSSRTRRSSSIDLGLHGDVERARRLVGEQHVRVQRERERDREALGLAARDLVRVAGEQRRVEQHALHPVDGAAPAGRRAARRAGAASARTAARAAASGSAQPAGSA